MPIGNGAFYPRLLGLAITQPGGVYEFVVFVQSRPGLLADIARVLADSGCDILFVSAGIGPDGKSPIILYVAPPKDFRPAETREKLLQVRDVLDVEFAAKKDNIYEEYCFPQMSREGVRAAIFPVYALESMFSNLGKALGEGAKVLLLEEGRNFARQATQTMRKILSNPEDTNLVLKNAATAFRAHGFGFLRYRKTGGDSYEAEVLDPLFSSSPDKVDYLVVGIVLGIFEEALGTQLKISEARFNPERRLLLVKIDLLS